MYKKPFSRCRRQSSAIRLSYVNAKNKLCIYIQETLIREDIRLDKKRGETTTEFSVSFMEQQYFSIITNHSIKLLLRWGGGGADSRPNYEYTPTEI